MVFSSIEFLYAFLPVTLLCYLIAPKKAKNPVLFFFSLLFYWWGEPKYAILMLFTITFCYAAGRLVENKNGTRVGKAILSVSVAVPLGLLALFKYADFFIGSFNSLVRTEIPLLKLALPIGISFYTFQALSYVVDVYRGDTPAQKSWINLATYVVLFPQLIAGPIVRYTTVAEDLETRKHSMENVAVGIRRFAVGLGKKVLIANILGSLCTAYRESADPSVLFGWVYAVSYSLQIYFDFSATLDVESAKLLTGIFSPACTSFDEFIVNHLKKDIAFIRLDFPDAFAPNTAQARERTTGISPPAEKVVSALSAFLSFKEVATIENVTFSLKERKFANENSKSIT